jgi:chorismate mutase/prephenate dehydratase
VIVVDKLEEIRRKIDATDGKILGALGERVSLAKEIGEYKRSVGLPVTDPAREHKVIQKIGDNAARSGLSREGVEEVYKEIIRLCRSVQIEETKIAFLGPRGTFCEQAAREYFREANAAFEEKPSITDVFRSVEVHETDRGVVPAENSNEGSVVLTLDLLKDTDLKISGEIILRISHNLIVRPDMNLNDISQVASHPQALAQCRRYLDENLPKANRLEVHSTAAAVKMASESHKVAAIGTELSAQLYGMKTLARGIEDDRNNQTRFFVLGTQDQEPTGNDRTTITFSVKHTPGSLHEALGTLSSRMINLSRIESRPARSEPWEYVFFCDFEGHRKNENCQDALEELRQKTIDLRILGSYPRAQ